MADGDGAVYAFLRQQDAHGSSHDVAAPDDDGVLAGGRDVVAADEDALRRGRHERRRAYGHAAHVLRVESVHVFARVDGFGHFLFRDVLGQRQLHDESVHIRVGVEPADALEQFGLGGVVFESDQGRLEAALFAGLYLVGHVGFAAAVVTHQHGHKVWLPASGCGHLPHFVGYFLSDFFRDFLAVYQFHNGSFFW